MNEPALHIDFETRSELDLPVVGLHRYARHPSTDAWCMAWALGEGEPQLWLRGEDGNRFDNAAFALMHVKAGRPVIAHNAPFELEIWNEIMVKRHGWPALAPAQTYCTMSYTYAMGLPGALEDAALALGLHVLKDGVGRALMLKFARPWRTDPVRWMDECPEFTLNGEKWTGIDGLKRLHAYCQQDVRVERELHKLLLPLSARERRVWLLDYKINQRGCALDMESVRGAVKLAQTVKAECGVELGKVTGGAVLEPTAVPALKAWMASRGVPVDSLAKQAVVDLLADRADLPADVRQALILRQEGGKASTAKFDVMEKRVGVDNRLRQMYQYHGAATGRWAGRGVQPANLPRDMPKAEVVEAILELVRKGDHNAIDMIYGAPLTQVSRCLRSFFVAPSGKLLVNGDFSNVEGRGGAWFCGETWKLQAFTAADNGTGPGIYELAYSRMFNVPVESVKDPSEERQVGKVSELAFLYQGGVGSGKTMGKTYGVKAPDAQWDEWKTLWRGAHPKVKATWPAIQNAAIAAVRCPGETYSCGHPGRQARFKMVGSFLWLLLPSGRALCYPYPKVLEGEFGPQLTYMTVPGQDKTKVIHDARNASNWSRVGTYGGALLNNIVQGFSRDLLVHVMLTLDEKGATTVIHTYDDVLIEVVKERAEGARVALRDIMCSPPAWAAGLPLIAKPKVMSRYGKG